MPMNLWRGKWVVAVERASGGNKCRTSADRRRRPRRPRLVTDSRRDRVGSGEDSRRKTAALPPPGEYRILHNGDSDYMDSRIPRTFTVTSEHTGPFLLSTFSVLHFLVVGFRAVD